MIRTAFIFLSAATLLCLTACDPDDQQKQPPKHTFGYTGSSQVGPAPVAGPTPTTPDTNPEMGGPIAPPPPPPPSTTGTGSGGPGPATQHDYPYAAKVPGKAGFVTSPYAPHSGYVDVRGFAPGTEVKDPYTQKVFLVP